MARFIIVRLLQAIVALIGITVIVFFLVRASGDPMQLLATPNMSQAQYEAIKSRLGLDKSWGEQLWIYVKNLAQGDLGQSLVREKPVTTMIKESLPNTLKLTVPSFIIGMFLAFVLGILAATFRDSWWDNLVKFLAVLGQALPGFWVAIMAMMIFSLYWPILPSGGTGSLKHYVLPVGTMMFFMLPGMMRLVRSSMLDVLDSEYIKLARIKGLPETRVIWKHALRNAIISPLTVAGMILAGLVTGAVITENVFIWPGMGRLMLESTFARDFPVVQAFAVIVAVMVLGMNFLVDIAYAWIDPQIRYEKS
jgi:peptide/nickel transport system permease protein